MFEGSLVESKHLLRTNTRWTTVLAIALQIAVAAAVVALPLLHPEALPFSIPRMTLVAPLPHPPTPPQTMRATAAASDVRALPMRTNEPIIHITHTSTGDAPDPGPTLITMNGSGPMPGVFSDGPTGPRVIASTGNGSGSIAGPAHPTRISTGVAQGLLLEPLHPVYPQIAIATRTQGAVVVQAVISKAGTIESMHVLSGPALLQNAAMQAVRNARYAPFKLNGDAVEVETTFTVNFSLN